MSKPVVGIGADLYAGERRDRVFAYSTYVESLRAAGVAPVVLPPQPENVGELLAAIDAIVLAGGPDHDPAIYGERRHEKTVTMDPRRQEGDLALARTAREAGIPALGICLGMQTMAVAAGGVLIQDIPSAFERALRHAGEPHERVRHEVRIEDSTRLATILGGGMLDVNSSHHQAVRTAGRGLVVTAFAPDGIVEALEDPEHPFYLGVQWHPEEMSGEVSAEALFRALADAAEQRRRAKRG